MILTKKRRLVLETLSSQNVPVEIKTLAKIIGKKMNETTIYRALELFVEEGMVGRINLSKDAAYYEVISSNHHHHLVCNNCGKVEDLKICDNLPKENEILKQTKNFKQVISHSLEYFGICKQCVA